MSGAYVGGFPEGGFQRVRDNVGSSYAAELKRENQLAEERERQKQLEQDRRDAFRAEENEKRRAANEAKAVQAFRDFYDGRGNVTDTVMRYAEARGYYRENYKIANAELLNPEFIKVYYPEKAARLENFANAKAWAADVKPDYVARCEFCRIVFLTNEEFAEHQRTTKPCPKCREVCSSGGQVHRCSVYGAAVIEDRVPEVKIGEE